MKFLIITEFGEKIVEKENIEQAAIESYDDHFGYDKVLAIVKIPENNE